MRLSIWMHAGICHRTHLLVAWVILMAACGGGGGDASPVSTTPPIDTTPPVITLLGNNPQVIMTGIAYTELGATALDDVDGNISGSIVIDSSSVDTSTIGSYSVTYDVTDSSGIASNTVIRTVTVQDSPPTVGIFTPLGDLPGGTFSSNATGVSDDGTVVVGVGASASGNEAFRWTSGTGMVGLGDLPGGLFGSAAEDVSDDGSVVVGQSQSSSEAFRWTFASGLVGLGDLPGGDFNSRAWGVSADGSVVVGQSEGASGTQAFRWTSAGGMVGLGDLPGGSFQSMALAVSADGSVVVGWSRNFLDNPEAFHWTAGTGMVGLGDNSVARDVSADGNVVVGSSQGGASRWTSGTGMVGLGDLDGNFQSRAVGVSGDGSVVVGQTFTHSGFVGQPFVWTQANGMQSLRDVLVANGATGLEGWQLEGMSGISADGQWVLGGGTNPSGFTEAFLANISAPSVTSAQMAEFLERGINGSGFSPPAAKGNIFLDVGASDFAAAFIEQLFLDGITSGCGGHNYCPNDTVTRAQMAVFLLRAEHGASYLPLAPTGDIFGDVDMTYWAAGWIEQLTAEGITSGCGDGNYCPDDAVTSAEIAVFLVKTFEL